MMIPNMLLKSFFPTNISLFFTLFVLPQSNSLILSVLMVVKELKNHINYFKQSLKELNGLGQLLETFSVQTFSITVLFRLCFRVILVIRTFLYNMYISS